MPRTIKPCYQPLFLLVGKVSLFIVICMYFAFKFDKNANTKTKNYKRVWLLVKTIRR